MRATLCLVFTLFLAASQAKKGSEADFFATMVLTESNLQEAFDGMDAEANGKIDMADLKRIYYHGEFEYARHKFIQMINKDSNKEICRGELDAFLKRPVITLAVFECTYIKSKNLRSSCFQDQVGFYVTLAVDLLAKGKFFRSIERQDDTDEVITIDEVKALAPLNSKFTDKEADNFMVEFDKDSNGKITQEEFFELIDQEDVLGEFRECRLKVDGANAEYDNECLKKKLIGWTMDGLTEKKVVATFDEFEDDDDNDIDITEEDIKKVSGCNEEIAQKFVRLMDKSKDGKVSYAEYRTFVRSPMVKLILERDCARKIEGRADEVKCFIGEIIERVQEMHTPQWLKTPSLDILFLFEELDKSGNGKIGVAKDLVEGHKWPQAVAQKMVAEIDGPDKDKLINLAEFLAYFAWPNIIYGITDCMSHGLCLAKIQCYNKELQDNIQFMLEKAKVDDFFHFYDKNGNGLITRQEVEAAGVTGEYVQNFLNEMGMGDDTVNLEEFLWFTRQQELSHMFADAKCQKSAELHVELVAFINKRFTQFDCQELFAALDTEKNWELTAEDWPVATQQVKAMLGRMDSPDKGTGVDFLEFWLYTHTPIEKPRKRQLEEKCTTKFEKQDEEMECYKTEIVHV